MKDLISFQSFLEGQALRITPDMVQFGREAVEKLNQGTWEYEQPVHEREVDGGPYGNRHIKVVPHVQDRKGFGWADYTTGELAFFAVKGRSYGEDHVDFIGHELVHMFDPKLNSPKLRDAKWGINAYSKSGKALGATGEPEGDHQYYTNPWEQDAFMSQSARTTIRDKAWLYDADWPTIQTSLQKIRPESSWEKVWYKNPKVWRKYLNTIYQELQRERS